MQTLSLNLISICIIVSISFFLGSIITWFFTKLYYRQNRSLSIEEFEKIQREKEDLAIEKGVSYQQVHDLKKERDTLMDKNETLNKISIEKSKENEFLKMQNEEKEKNLIQLHKQFSDEFKNIANEALLKNSKQLSESTQKSIGYILDPLQKKIETFSKETKSNINEVLEPFKQNIESFGKKIEDSRKEQIQESTSLKEQLKQLEKLNQDMTKETQNLTNALKGDNKTQGNWGEMILENLLEKSGLQKNEQYLTQQTFKTSEGTPIRPDVVIKLPEEKLLIIDSKVSLKHYELYCNEENEAEKNFLLKQHSDSLRKHVKSLSEKEYQTKISEIGQNIYRTPDFVLMFLPIEHSYHVAIKSNKDLFQEALDKNIIIVTPSTLFMTLRIIWNIWKQEKQGQNVQQIAEEGGKLYDHFVRFVEEFEKVGSTIKKAGDIYEETYKKLSNGRGNLIKKAEDLRKLGIKNKKQISESLITQSEEEHNSIKQSSNNFF